MKGRVNSKAAGYESLRKLVAGLREVASGAVLANAILRINRYMAGRVRGELAKHVKTGLTRNTATIVPSKNAITITLQRTHRYIKWSFAKGIPRTAINRARKIIAEELAKATKGEPSS